MFRVRPLRAVRAGAARRVGAGRCGPVRMLTLYSGGGCSKGGEGVSAIGQEELKALLDFAVRMADEAAGVILPLFNNVKVEWKADGSEVTAADRGAETAIRRMIEREYPAHGIIGEEFGRQDEGATLQWVIDPIDGTQGFSIGLPTFGTLIGLLEDGEPILGVIGLPAMSETVFAARGLGCWYRARGATPARVQVAAATSLAAAHVSTTGTHNSDIEIDGSPTYLTGAIRAARRFRFGADCAQHALVARGRLDAAIDTEMKPWDTAALVPCVEEAGGVVSTVTGVRPGVVFGGSLITACCDALRQELVQALRR